MDWCLSFPPGLMFVWSEGRKKALSIPLLSVFCCAPLSTPPTGCEIAAKLNCLGL